jgi:hypothetical protein
MTSFATKYSSQIGSQSGPRRPSTKAALLVATIAFSVVCQSLPLSAAGSARNVTGEWEFLSNNTDGTLTIKQLRSPFRCKELTGTLDAFDVGPIVGLYCPDDLHITFARFKDGEDAPFQMYEGYVSDSGQTMAGKFFYWGNEGPLNMPTAPFVGRR